MGRSGCQFPLRIIVFSFFPIQKAHFLINFFNYYFCWLAVVYFGNFQFSNPDRLIKVVVCV